VGDAGRAIPHRSVSRRIEMGPERSREFGEYPEIPNEVEDRDHQEPDQSGGHGLVRFGDLPVTTRDDPASEETHDQIKGELDSQENLDEIEDLGLLGFALDAFYQNPRKNKKARRAGRARDSLERLRHSAIGTDRRDQGQKEYALRAIKQVIFHVGLFRIRQFTGPVKIQKSFDPIAILIHGLTRFLASRGEALGNFPVIPTTIPRHRLQAVDFGIPKGPLERAFQEDGSNKSINHAKG